MLRFLAHWDSGARKEAFRLEMKGKLPPRFTEQHYPLSFFERLELRRLKAADVAATTVDVWVALCRGEAVPARMLNQRLVQDHKRRLRV